MRLNYSEPQSFRITKLIIRTVHNNLYITSGIYLCECKQIVFGIKVVSHLQATVSPTFLEQIFPNHSGN